MIAYDIAKGSLGRKVLKPLPHALLDAAIENSTDHDPANRTVSPQDIASALRQFAADKAREGQS